MTSLAWPATLSPRQKTDPGTVLVLGGSGFVGVAIIEALRLRGVATISAQRHPTPDRVDQKAWDATQPRGIHTLLQSNMCVVNAVSGNSRTMLAATRAMAVAASEGHPIIHISSMSVYGDTRGTLSENTPLRPATRYAATKIACEKILANTNATILRPGIVYGPGSAQWVGRLGRLLRARRLGDLGKHGDGRCNLIHARDLGEAVAAALANPNARGQAINIGMASPPRWNEYLVAFARAIGAVPVSRIPAWRLSLETFVLAPPLHLVARLRHRTLPDPISPALTKLFAQDSTLDCSLAKQCLGASRTSLTHGLAESAAWFIETHGLAQP
jgi:nucleoside-diphosphate-sugar epimerase